jgi:hypothetical protein
VATHRTHAFDPWKLREKLSALLQSCIAQKADGLPFPANPARRMRRALFFTLRDTHCAQLPVRTACANGYARPHAGCPDLYHFVAKYCSFAGGRDGAPADAKSAGLVSNSAVLASEIEQLSDLQGFLELASLNINS